MQKSLMSLVGFTLLFGAASAAGPALTPVPKCAADAKCQEMGIPKKCKDKNDFKCLCNDLVYLFGISACMCQHCKTLKEQTQAIQAAYDVCKQNNVTIPTTNFCPKSKRSLFDVSEELAKRHDNVQGMPAIRLLEHGDRDVLTVHSIQEVIKTVAPGYVATATEYHTVTAYVPSGTATGQMNSAQPTGSAMSMLNDNMEEQSYASTTTLVSTKVKTVTKGTATTTGDASGKPAPSNAATRAFGSMDYFLAGALGALIVALV